MRQGLISAAEVLERDAPGEGRHSMRGDHAFSASPAANPSGSGSGSGGAAGRLGTAHSLPLEGARATTHAC